MKKMRLNTLICYDPISRRKQVYNCAFSKTETYMWEYFKTKAEMLTS